MIRKLYDWVLAYSARPSAPWALAIVAFAESSIFPVPPDVLQVPMSLARPDKAWRYALIATIASVLGGLVGYAIGALLYDSLGLWLSISMAMARRWTRSAPPMPITGTG